MTYIQLREAETGRFCGGFWLDNRSLATLETHAGLRGISMDQLLSEAIQEYAERCLATTS